MDMRVEVDQDLGPACQLGRNAGQSIEQAFLYFGKALERCFAGRAVNAVAGLAHHPRLQADLSQCQMIDSDINGLMKFI